MNERELVNLPESIDVVWVSDYTLDELENILNEKPNFKEKYFEYYDDVKCSTRKKQDW